MWSGIYSFRVMTESKKLGRPPLNEEVKRCPISVRVTPTMKAAIEAVAKANGRSITQEIELRLELSFARERWEREAIAKAFAYATEPRPTPSVEMVRLNYEVGSEGVGRMRVTPARVSSKGRP